MIVIQSDLSSPDPGSGLFNQSDDSQSASSGNRPLSSDWVRIISSDL